MKKVNFLNLIAAVIMSTAMINLTSCSKAQSDTNKETQPEQIAFKSQVSIDFQYDVFQNTLEGNDLEQELFWQLNNTNLGSVYFDYDDMDEITIISNSQNILTFEMEGKIFEITTVSSSPGQINFNLEGPNQRPVAFEIIGGAESLDNYFTNFTVGQTIIYGTNKTQWAWPVVFAAAALIGGLVDAYCDDLVKVSVNECVAAGGKPHVGNCKVTCDCCYVR